MTKSQLVTNIGAILVAVDLSPFSQFSHQNALDLIEANINEFCADLIKDIAEILSGDC